MSNGTLLTVGSRSGSVPSGALKRRYVLLPPQRISARVGAGPLDVDAPRLRVEVALVGGVAPPTASAERFEAARLAERMDLGTSQAFPARAAQAPGWRRGFRMFLPMLLATFGAVLAFQLARTQNGDLPTWSALGGAAGLLVGWACLLWMHPED